MKMNGNRITYRNHVNSSISPLILTINTIGDDLIGLELGVGNGESFLTILQK